MDDLQEALARYMVRRDSLRRIRERNRDFNSTCTDPQKSDEPSTYRGFSTSMENHRKLDQTKYYSLKNSTQNSYEVANKIKDNVKSFFLHDEYDRSIEKLPPNDDFHDSLRPFELSNPKKWNKPSKNVANEGSKKNENVEISSDDNTSLLENMESHEDESAQLLNTRDFDAEIPSKIMAELKNIEIADNRSVLEKFSHDVTESSITSLTEAIEHLDIQIKNLEMRNTVNTTFTARAQVENPSRIYPSLDDVKFDSTIPVRKNFYSQLNEFVENEGIVNSNETYSNELEDDYKNPANDRIIDEDHGKSEDEILGHLGNPGYNEDDESSINNYSEIIPKAHNKFCEKSTIDEISRGKSKSEEDVFYQETPRLSRKTPIMESTRKSLHSDSTKIYFPTPTRVDPNSISTIQISMASKSSEMKNDEKLERKLNETIPYEVEHFLEDALGDDFLNTTDVTYATCEARDRTDSHFTASELISHDGTPLHRRIMEAVGPPMTEPTQKNFTVFDRSMDMCRSLSQRFKKKFRSGIKREVSPPPVPILPPKHRGTDGICQLLQEVNLQQTLMNQATKALNLCRTMKEFIDSPERIESERLLLISGLRKKCMIQEIKRITSSDERVTDNDYVGQKGEITIKDISLDLKDFVRREIEEDDMTEWFVLVVTHGLKVWATRPVTYQLRDTKVSFPEEIFIPDLTPNFQIIIEVYTMRVRNTSYNHEDKYRIRTRRMRRSTSCPPCPNILVSPTKLLKKIERPYSTPKTHSVRGSPGTKNSDFALSGVFEAYLLDLNLPSPWLMWSVPGYSILEGTMDLDLACRIHLSVNHEGFVNYGDEAGGLAIWNRRFCVLKGHTLMFWNYPDERETKEPLKTIDLIDCVSGKVATADRRICPRPRTLFFGTARPRTIEDRNSLIFECKKSRTIIRNLISLDSVKELMEWSWKLNQVITALREWNVIHVREGLQISDR